MARAASGTISVSNANTISTYKAKVEIKDSV